VTASLSLLVPLAVDPVLYGAYVAAWAFFAYGPQLVICMLFAWSACKRTRGDMLDWLIKGFLWSLLPFVGVAVMWWIWRQASRRAGNEAGGARRGKGAGTAGHRDGAAVDDS
jgi:hypothetical protein